MGTIVFFHADGSEYCFHLNTPLNFLTTAYRVEHESRRIVVNVLFIEVSSPHSNNLTANTNKKEICACYMPNKISLITNGK